MERKSRDKYRERKEMNRVSVETEGKADRRNRGDKENKTCMLKNRLCADFSVILLTKSP